MEALWVLGGIYFLVAVIYARMHVRRRWGLEPHQVAGFGNPRGIYSGMAGLIWPITMLLNASRGNGVLPRWSGYVDHRIEKKPRGMM